MPETTDCRCDPTKGEVCQEMPPVHGYQIVTLFWCPTCAMAVEFERVGDECQNCAEDEFVNGPDAYRCNECSRTHLQVAAAASCCQ